MHRILAEEELALIPEEMCENKRYINYCSNEYSPETIDTDMYSVGWNHYNVTDGLHWKYHAPWWYRPPSYTDTFTLKSMSRTIVLYCLAGFSIQFERALLASADSAWL